MSNDSFQVIVASLHHLQCETYKNYCEQLPTHEDPMEFDWWYECQKESQPQFLYWAITSELQLLLLQFVRSLREANFQLYVQILGKLMPWFFSMGLTNYSRWLPVHIRDMVTLPQKHPQVYDEFMKGHSVVKKTKNRFSAMGMDQAHEQENCLIKGDGGAVGLTEDPSALHRWMVCGPEVAHLVSQYEECIDIDSF